LDGGDVCICSGYYDFRESEATLYGDGKRAVHGPEDEGKSRVMKGIINCKESGKGKMGGRWEG
jgi:hypothetical protein